MKSLKLNLLADYFQFHFQDEAAPGDLSGSWTEETTARMLATAPGTVGIGTMRNMVVPVVVEVHDQEPHDDSSEWDQVIEASLDVSSGRLVVAGCSDFSPMRSVLRSP